MSDKPQKDDADTAPDHAATSGGAPGAEAPREGEVNGTAHERPNAPRPDASGAETDAVGAEADALGPEAKTVGAEADAPGPEAEAVGAEADALAHEAEVDDRPRGGEAGRAPEVDAQVPTAALSEAEADSLLPEVRKVTNVLQDHSGEYDALFEQKISLIAAISSHEAAITRAKAMLKIVDEAIEKRMREKSKREREDEERRLREEFDKFREIDDRLGELTRDYERRANRFRWIRDLFRRGSRD